MSINNTVCESDNAISFGIGQLTNQLQEKLTKRQRTPINEKRDYFEEAINDLFIHKYSFSGSPSGHGHHSGSEGWLFKKTYTPKKDSEFDQAALEVDIKMLYTTNLNKGQWWNGDDNDIIFKNSSIVISYHSQSMWSRSHDPDYSKIQSFGQSLYNDLVDLFNGIAKVEKYEKNNLITVTPLKLV